MLCGTEGYQIKCKWHVVVESTDGYMYKLLYDAEEQRSFAVFLRRMQTTTSFKNLIYPEDVTPQSFTTMQLQRYSRAKFGPLNEFEAKKCLRNFVIGAKSALDELHLIGLMHNDVRLPNFCFNASFEVILIDLDRVWPIEQEHPMFYGEENKGRSCMYLVDSSNRTGIQTDDFIQLGWLVAWVLEPALDYHMRTLESHAEFVRNDEFVSTLATSYNFDMNLLD